MKNIDGQSLIKRLASCNKSVREKTLDILLIKWLPSQTQLDDDDMKKLWKGSLLLRLALRQGPRTERSRRTPLLRPALPPPPSLPSILVCLPPHHAPRVDRPFLPLKKEVLEELFGPFVLVMKKVQDKVLVGKIKSCVFDVLFKQGSRLLEVKKSGEEGDGSTDDDVVVLGTIGLVMGFSA